MKKINRKRLRYLNGKIVISLFLILGSVLPAVACTTAVVSGKVTPDGRPLLWKHRDTWSLTNKIVQFFDGKYACTGLVNSVDTLNESIWIGFNSQGFAIMNSASYNLNNDTIVTSGFEGRLIKQALQNCASVADFEQMIINMPKPTRLEGNFGVIDASGGAVYFELGNFSYIKYDANNSIDAPNGYLIRTNYSFSGEEDGGGGYIRYVTTNDVFEKAVSNNTLNYCTIIQDGSRNLKNSLTGVDLNTYLNLPENQTTYVTLQDFIPRNGSVSSCVVQGVSPGENPSLTTMWSVVGFPLTSLTIPIFLNKEVDLPVVVKYDSLLKDSPMSHYSLVLKDEVFSFKHGIDKNYYIDVNKVLNADSTGYLQKIIPLENQIIQESEKYITQWKSENKCDNAQLKELYNWIDDKINTFFRTNYNLNHHDVF